jgi:cysteine-rich repeat protein
MIKGTETCDDGNGVEGDGCSAQCLDEPGWDCSSGVCVLSPSFDGGIDVGERTYLRCGDGIVSGAEECDDGETNDGNAYGACASTCTYAAYCGDGIVNGPEECDLGERNGAVTYGVGGCTRTCAKSHFCGDGIIDAAYGEECDLGVLNGLAVDAGIGCTSDCRVWPIGPP